MKKICMILCVIMCIAFCSCAKETTKIVYVDKPQNEQQNEQQAEKGSYVVYSLQDENGDTVQNPEKDILDIYETLLRTRLDSAGYLDATISVKDNGKIEVFASGEVENIWEMLGDASKLTFRDYEGNVILDGFKGVKKATCEYGEISEFGEKEHYINLELTNEGQAAFSYATDRISKLSEGENIIAVYVDEQIISAPRVAEKIDSSNCVISGNFDADSAKMLAAQINSGLIPYKLTVLESRNID